MNTKKRMLSILLALVMVLGMLPISAFAADPSDFTIVNGVLTKYTGGGGNVVIPSGVTSIEDHTFYGCTSLTSVSIPSSVTSIGEGTFGSCTNLTSVSIPSSVTSIGEGAFGGCINLTSVVIPSGVTSIGEGMFYNCANLSSVSIPSSVTSIGKSAFEGCTSLTSVSIPNSVTSIGEHAFQYCTSLTSVVIPEGVTSIKFNTFLGCTRLSSVSIPSSVTSIESQAFVDCTSLTSVNIPSSVTSIGYAMFNRCTSLTSVGIPSSVTTIGESAFYGCTGLTDVYYAGSKEDWKKISIGSYNQDLTNATIHYAGDSSGVKPENDNNSTKPEYYWATFDARPGKFSASDIAGGYFHEEGGTLAAPRGTNGRYLLKDTPPIPVRDGYTFVGWRINFVDGEKDSKLTGQIVKDFTNFDFPADLTFEAEWEKAGPEAIAFEWNSYEVTVGKTQRIGMILPDLASGARLGVGVDQEGIIDINPTYDGKYLTVSGKSPGVVKLTISTEDGRSASCKITVRKDNAVLSKSLLKCDFSGSIQRTQIFLVFEGIYRINLKGTIQIRDYETDDVLFQKSVSEFDPDYFCVNGDDTVNQTNVDIYISAGDEISAFSGRKVYFYSTDFIIDPNTGHSPDLSEAKDLLTTKIEPDRWSFPNINDDNLFLPEFTIKSKQDYDFLTANMSHTEKNRFDNSSIYGEKWGGSCYGMSLIPVLKAIGKADAKQFDPAQQAVNLFDIKKSPGDTLESKINYFMMTQYLDGPANHEDAFKLLSTKMQLKIIEGLALEAENGGSPFVLSYCASSESKSNFGHTVVGYGLERGEFSKEDAVFDSRVRIYDCSNEALPLEYYLYFNSGTDQWCIPIPDWDVHKFEAAFNDPSLLDPQGYLTKVTPTAQQSARSRLIVDSPNGKFGFTLELNGKRYHVDETTDERAAGIVSYFDVAAASSGGQRTMYVTLPSPNVDCTIIPDAGTSCSYTLYTPDALFCCNATGADNIYLTPSGEIRASGTAGTYSCTLCFDEGLKGLPWYSVDVSGAASSDLRIVPQDKGILISGQKLGGITLLCENDQSKTTVKLSAQDAVLLTTKSDGKTPAVYQDSNGDGTFETEVDISVSAGDHSAQLPDADTEKIAFTDVPADAYYYDAVAWAVEQGITSGTSATTFSPNASCTRAQTVTFLWRAAGSPAPKSGTNPFTDVRSDSYYYDAVLWAVEQNITSGTSATTFSPDAAVTRAQTVTFLYRAAGSPPALVTSSFLDVDENAWYAGPVQWAVAKEITNGTSASTFAPDAGCTRAQIVTFLYRDMA